jgi:AsmA family protein
VLRLEALEAVVAGGRMAGLTQLDARGDPAKCNADMRFENVDLAGWLPGTRAAAAAASAPPPDTARKALKRERQQASAGGDQPVRSYVTGELRGRFKLEGRGRSTADILGSMNGVIQATLRDGTISHVAQEVAGLDIAQAVGVLIRGDRPLPLRCAAVEMEVKQGVAHARQAVMDNRDSVVQVAGTVDLRQETLALKATVKPKDISLMTLRTPVHVAGTFTKPKVSLEPMPIAGRVAAALALGALSGPAALLPFIDLGDRSMPDPCAGDAPAAAKSSAKATEQMASASKPTLK